MFPFHCVALRCIQAGGSRVAALLASGRELQLHACSATSIAISEPQLQPQPQLPLYTLEAPQPQRFHQIALVSPRIARTPTR